LIRRFIDPRARFVWLKSPKDCPNRALGFDFDGATFTHLDGKVTFEVLVDSFGLHEDRALRAVGGLIHYLDVGGIPVGEAAGVEALLKGACQMFSDDDALVEEAARIFELLYQSYLQRGKVDKGNVAGVRPPRARRGPSSRTSSGSRGSRGGAQRAAVTSARRP